MGLTHQHTKGHRVANLFINFYTSLSQQGIFIYVLLHKFPTIFTTQVFKFADKTVREQMRLTLHESQTPCYVQCNDHHLVIMHHNWSSQSCCVSLQCIQYLEQRNMTAFNATKRLLLHSKSKKEKNKHTKTRRFDCWTPCPRQGHLGSPHPGLKVVNVDTTWECLTQWLCIPNKNVMLYIDQRSQQDLQRQTNRHTYL